MKNRKTFWKGMGLGALIALLFACSTPQASPVIIGGQTRYANTQENLDKCVAWDGTAIRDPQPPRPSDDPGPYFICVWPVTQG